MNGDEGRYITPPGQKRSLLLHIVRSPSICFYILLLKIVFISRWKVWRGTYSRVEWVRSSNTVRTELEKVGVRFDISGLHHLEQSHEPVVIIGNHMSMLETMILPSVVQPRRDCTFIVKKQLLTYPVFGPIMRSINPIAVSRTNPKEDFTTVMHEGEKRLRDGISIVIFPQRTRLPYFQVEDFNSLGVKLASRSSVSVIALALKTDAWMNGKWLRDFGKIDPSKKVYLSFSEPIQITLRGNEAHRQTIDFISEHIHRWTEETHSVN